MDDRQRDRTPQRNLMTQLHSEQDAIKQAVGARYLCNPGNAAPSTAKFKNDGRTCTIRYSFKDGMPTGTEQDFPIAWILQDPAFWKSLGKSFGWYAGEWKQKAMDYFEWTICEGKSADEFFKELK